METPSYIALSSQTALRNKLELIANNIANMNTTAYQGEFMLFEEYVSDTGDSAAGDLQNVSLVQDYASVRDTTPGPIESTDNPLDLAISGDAYFAIETAEGRRYTRDGTFTLNADGEIVTSAGNILAMANGQAAIVPNNATDIEISRDGLISARVDGSDVELGQIQLYRFDNPESLLRGPENLFELAEEGIALAAADSEIIQGSLEQSNVLGVVEITNMIDVVHNYTAVSRMVQAEHERQQQAIRSLAGSTA